MGITTSCLTACCTKHSAPVEGNFLQKPVTDTHVQSQGTGRRGDDNRSSSRSRSNSSGRHRRSRPPTRMDTPRKRIKSPVVTRKVNNFVDRMKDSPKAVKRFAHVLKRSPQHAI